MSNYVFVIDADKKTLLPVHPGQARRLLRAGKAAVYRRYPMTIILKGNVPDANPQPLRLKLDPGAKTTGLAILQGEKVLWAAELCHRGFQIRDNLTSRRGLRRGRRSRHTRYRRPPKHEWSRKGKRFKLKSGRVARMPVAKHRRNGWLPPSLVSRLENILTWVNRLCKVCPIAAISQELVRFDTQLMQDPYIQGKGYQQGTLYQYEVREYVLEKWGRKCAYCDAKHVPLEVEHIYPRSKGGSNRPSNLTLACVPCNQAKGNQDIRDFLTGDPERLNQILGQAKQPLAGAAAVNATRWALFNRLKDTRLPVETGSGGLTKFNRTRFNLPKTHWLDAACVGHTPQLQVLINQPLLIKALGHGVRQRAIVNKHGFPIQHRGRFKFSHGFKTGDIVNANIPKGKYAGQYKGVRIGIRQKPTFAIYPNDGGKQFDAHAKYLKVIHSSDGYAFNLVGRDSSQRCTS